MALAVRYVTATLTAPETSVARTRIGRSFETNARTRRNVANSVSGALSVSPTDADGCAASVEDMDMDFLFNSEPLYIQQHACVDSIRIMENGKQSELWAVIRWWPYWSLC